MKMRTLNVITKNLAMTLSSTLSETLTVITMLNVSYGDEQRAGYTLPPLPRPDIIDRVVKGGSVKRGCLRERW